MLRNHNQGKGLKINRSDAIIAGMVGGVIGVFASAIAVWISWSVYEDQEFDVAYFTIIYALALFVTAILLLTGATWSRLTGAPPKPRIVIAAIVSSVVALASGSAFGIAGISGPPTFVLIFVLPPCGILLASASLATWFAKRGSL
jgi:hypothetical protein